jgi:hypothetical protein
MEMNVPEPPIVFDTNLIVNLVIMDFRLFNANGTEVTITSVLPKTYRN